MVRLSEEGEKAPGKSKEAKGPAFVASETVSDCRTRPGKKDKEVAWVDGFFWLSGEVRGGGEGTSEKP